MGHDRRPARIYPHYYCDWWEGCANSKEDVPSDGYAILTFRLLRIRRLFPELTTQQLRSFIYLNRTVKTGSKINKDRKYGNRTSLIRSAQNIFDRLHLQEVVDIRDPALLDNLKPYQLRAFINHHRPWQPLKTLNPLKTQVLRVAKLVLDEELLFWSEPCRRCYASGGFCKRDSPEEDCYGCKSCKKKQPCRKVLFDSKSAGRWRIKKKYEEKSQRRCSQAKLGVKD